MASLPDTAQPRSKKIPDSEMPLSTAGSTSPKTFFLRSERDMQAARGLGRASPLDEQREEHATLEDSTYGVQSLEDTFEAAFPTQPSLTRSQPDDGNNADTSSGSRPKVVSPAPISGKKRKIGNPIHPKIAAAGHRIISSESPASRASSRSSVSPIRHHLRSTSNASSIQSFTQLRHSPRLDSDVPDASRAGSVRSLRFSDEEGSVVDDNGSQVLHSSSGEEEEDEDLERTLPQAKDDEAVTESTTSGPQLVMPSLAMPTRRPFTERGKYMGRLKIMVVGPSGIGKTSLLRSIVQCCEDIVHVDPIIHVSSSNNQVAHEQPQRQGYGQSQGVTEMHASTRTYPSWWSDMDEHKSQRRRRSTGDVVLERNLCFVDTPGWTKSGQSGDENMQVSFDHVNTYIEEQFLRNWTAGELGDTEVLSLLSGGGGYQVDLVIYLLSPTCHQISPAELDILRQLSLVANVVPVIAKADRCSQNHLHDHRKALLGTLGAAGIDVFHFHDKQSRDSVSDTGRHTGLNITEPFAISSATGSDDDVMDASILMSSEYRPPVVPSDLAGLMNDLFEPQKIQEIRHHAVKKFLHWRRNNHDRLARRRPTTYSGPLINQAASIPDCDDAYQISMAASFVSSPSGVLITYPSSEQHNKPAPTPLGIRHFTPAPYYDFGRYRNRNGTDMDVRSQTGLASWATDLQRAIDVERLQHSNGGGCGKTLSISDHDDLHDTEQTAMTKWVKPDADATSTRRGLGASTLDTRDPLGVLAFGHAFDKRGRQALQILGGCGVVATVAVWLIRNWDSISEMLGFSSPDVHLPGYALVGPAGRHSSFGADWDLRGLLLGR